MICDWCDHDPSKQAQCQCLPQPTVRRIHKQLLLASKLSSEFGRVTASMYAACDVATSLLMRSTYRDMSIPAKVVFWDLVAEHFTV